MSAETGKTPYPLYLMQVGNKRQFFTLRDAGKLYDCGFVFVDILGDVMESDGTIRQITSEEKKKIADIADEYSANK